MLNNVASGAVRSRVSWSSLATRPARHKDDLALVVVHLHSCHDISSHHHLPPDAVVSVSLNKVTKVSSKSYGNSNPIFEERLLLFSNNPTVDDVKIDVIDMKTDTVAGSVSVEVSQLLSRDDLCMMDETFSLGKVTQPQFTVRLSCSQPTSTASDPARSGTSQNIFSFEYLSNCKETRFETFLQDDAGSEISPKQPHQCPAISD